jgi:hypothetical protein
MLLSCKNDNNTLRNTNILFIVTFLQSANKVLVTCYFFAYPLILCLAIRSFLVGNQHLWRRQSNSFRIVTVLRAIYRGIVFRNLSGAKFFFPPSQSFETGYGVHPALYLTMVAGFFPGDKTARL